MKIVVLVAGSGNTTGLNVIKALCNHYEVIGCDYCKANPANLFCRNYQVPAAASAEYAGAILDIIKKEGVTHVIASNDHDLRTLANLNAELDAHGVNFNGYTKDILKFLDKDETYKHFLTNGILTPKVYESEPQFPFVLRKCKMGDEHKFVHIVKTEEEYCKIPEWDKRHGIYSEFIDGQEYTIDVLCDENANVLSATPRLRLEVRGGMVWHGKVIHDVKLIETVKVVCKKVNIIGIACLQCIKQNDAYYFIEINPRPGSGIDLSIAAGNNLPLLWVKLSCGEVVEVKEPNWELELIRYYQGYYFKP